MSDLPPQEIFQQMNARRVAGEHLEVLGKQAAAMWSDGRVRDLNDAVVAVVKTAGLSPEQVKRVVEFTNTAAYLSEFNKEGSSHRVVDFGGVGPANPSTVLQDLNDGGGGSLFDSGSSDYNAPPRETKTASAYEEAAFAQMFHTSGAAYPEVNPLGDVIDLRDKLGSAYEEATSQLSSLEVDYNELSDRLFNHVKQAAMSGHALSEIVEIWSREAPSEEHVKVAFAHIMPQLVENGVFRTSAEMADSLTKHAHVGVVNSQHPLVGDFHAFCDTLSKMAEARDVQQECGEGVARLTAFLKEASAASVAAEAVSKAKPGLLERAGGALNWTANKARSGGEGLGKLLLGTHPDRADTIKNIGEAAHIGTKYVLPAAVGYEAYRRNLKYSPTYHKALSLVPGTAEHAQKDMELQMQAQGYTEGY